VKFIQSFLISILAMCMVYFCAILLLIDAPIPAEYWVGEMIAVKKELVKTFAGKKKIIIAGGSSTLFGIDAEYAGKQLGMPVINFGLHAALKLERILKQVGSVVENGDTVILALEPPYYGCNTGLDSFQVENTIAWDHESWLEMNYLEKRKFIFSISPGLLGQMLFAETLAKFYPAAISDRLVARDHAGILSRFRSRTTPETFEYSAFNLDDFGDIQRTEGAKYYGKGYDKREPRHICDSTMNVLKDFVRSMKKKEVHVYFANTPYLASSVNMAELQKIESDFLEELSSVGCMIDRRQDLFFDRKYLFNTSLHLNTEGRRIRTDLLTRDIRKNVLSGACGH
jgi:hypothetical protein